MKPFLVAMTAVAFLGSTLSAQALEKPDRKIVLACSATHRPMMAEVVQAIAFSDYEASPSVRREILELARAACSSRPEAVLTFAPPPARSNAAPDAELASK